VAAVAAGAAGLGGAVGAIAMDTSPATAPFAPFLTKEQELDLLRSQAKSFEQALDDLRRRIQEVESGPEGVAAT
jgi:hypothetical protein